MTPLIKSTILSQYANSPILMRLIGELTDAIDPGANIEQFYKLVMNLHTAKGFGLDVWGRIVGIDRNIGISDSQGEYFGFADGFYPFNNRPFFAGNNKKDGISDNAYRHLIIMKALANIIYATAPNINKMLKVAFDNRRCYYLITGPMQAQYVFEFKLTVVERFIVNNMNILPHPCGVTVDIVEVV